MRSRDPFLKRVVSEVPAQVLFEFPIIGSVVLILIRQSEFNLNFQKF